MEILLLLLFFGLLVLAPIVLVIMGIAFIANPDPKKKKKGKYLLLSGVLVVLVEILVGFSICSGIRF